MNQCYNIRIQVLENGFTVEVPDMDAIKKKQTESKKRDGPAAMPYTGDCTETYAAKTVAEVMKLVKTALSQIPESEFSAAFEEATTKGT